MKKTLLLITSIYLLTLGLQAQNTWATYTVNEGLVNNSAKCLEIDSLENIWIGTENGVSVYDGTSFTNYTTLDGLANNSVLSIFIDSQNHKWFGTMGGGVSKFDGTTWTTYTPGDGLASALVYAIFEDSNSDMWFGTTSGVSKFDGTTWTTYNSTNGLTSNVVSDINEDSQGNIWIGLWVTGLSIFDGTNWTSISTSTTLVHDQVTQIFRANDNYMWIGTTDGFTVYDDMGVWESNYTVLDGIFDDWIQGIDSDSQNNIWFATYTDYLNEGAASLFDGTNWTNYHPTDGLASNNVRDVLVEDDNTIWFATALGLNKFYLSTGADDNISLISEFNCYPNPTSDKCYIELNETYSNVEFTLYNSIGNEIKNLTLTNTKNFDIDLNLIETGIYIIKINTGRNIISKKIIKN